MPRGGKRTGTPGKAYASRSDLNRPAPGQTYGQGVAQQAAMKAVPIGAPPPVPTASGASEQAPPDLEALAQGWQPLAGAPDQTARPNEPTTAGLSLGPGSGPEALPQVAAPQNPDLARMLGYLPMLEQLASNPHASAATRSLYRQLVIAKMQAGQ